MADAAPRRAPLIGRVAGVGILVARGTALPPGAGAAALGFASSGLLGWVFLVLAGRSLGARATAPLSAFWSFAFVLGPGLFFPIEQLLSRAMSTGRSSGARAFALRRGGTLCLGSLLLLGALWPFVARRLFEDDPTYLVAAALVLAGCWLQHSGWGLLGGTRRFFLYGLVGATEGLVRLSACLILVLSDAQSSAPYALVLGVSSLISGFVAVLLARRIGGGPRDSTAMTGLPSLLAASLAAQGLLLGGPVAVKYLAGPAHPEQASQLLAASLLIRAPIFMFNAVVATLLPHLGRQAASGEWDGVQRGLRRLILSVIAAGSFGTVLVALGASRLLGSVFGGDFRLDRSDLAILGLGATAYLTALVLTAGAVSTDGDLPVAVAYVAGLTTFLATLLVPIEPLRRAEFAFAAGAATVALALLTSLRRSIRASSRPTATLR